MKTNFSKIFKNKIDKLSKEEQIAWLSYAYGFLTSEIVYSNSTKKEITEEDIKSIQKSLQRYM